MIRKCDRCNRRRECTPVPSTLGLSLGHTCGACRRFEAKYAERARRVLERLDRVPERQAKVIPALYVRRFPVAQRIASELVKDSALLALRTRLLAEDVSAVFRVHPTTARLAVAMARRAA